jgi:hypothetical protein
MCTRDRLGANWSWTLSLAVHEVDSFLLSILERLGWGYRKILEGDGVRWEMAPRLDSVMIVVWGCSS